MVILTINHSTMKKFYIITDPIRYNRNIFKIGTTIKSAKQIMVRYRTYLEDPILMGYIASDDVSLSCETVEEKLKAKLVEFRMNHGMQSESEWIRMPWEALVLWIKALFDNIDIPLNTNIFQMEEPWNMTLSEMMIVPQKIRTYGESIINAVNISEFYPEITGIERLRRWTIGKTLTGPEKLIPSSKKSRNKITDENVNRFEEKILSEQTEVILTEEHDEIKIYVKSDKGRAFCDAARQGRLGLLKWLQKNGYSYDANAYYLAAKGNHLKVLEWLDENRYPTDGVILDFVPASFEILVCFLRKESVWKGDYDNYNVRKRIIETYHTELITWAASKNTLPLYIRNDLDSFLGKTKSLAELKSIKNNGYIISSSVADSIVTRGKIDLLEWLVEEKYRLTVSIFNSAVLGGNLETLKWLRKNKCPWDNRACAYAASVGHLEIVKWLRSENCPWTARTLKDSRISHPEIFKWAIENGCPLDEKATRIVLKQYPELTKYIIDSTA